jgi:hypothetical protein
MTHHATLRSEARKLFYRCTAEEADALFWGATSFPFMGTGENARRHYRNQLKQGIQETDGTVDAVLARAERIMDEAMWEAC